MRAHWRRIRPGWYVLAPMIAAADGVARRTTNARLHVEVWDGDASLGADLAPDEVRLLSSGVFVGP
ncbi:MAG: hypothetical protein H0U69_07575 [Trueperaceae bacterium]|nr:hypothetical protein [Trueperaceae bacterium]